MCMNIKRNVIVQKRYFLYLLLLISNIQLFAIDIDKISYSFDENDNSATVTGCQSNVTRLDIPSSVTYNGKVYNVTKIGKSAFSSNRNLTYVYIPPTITLVDNGAFYSCSGIKEIYLADGEESIEFGYSYSGYYGANPMFYYSKLEKVYLGRDIVVAGSYAPFKGQELLNDVIIGEMVKTLPTYCFEGASLSEIIIPSSIITIRDYSFSGCTNLKKVIFRDGIDELSLGYHRYTRQIFSGWEDVYTGLFYDSPLEYVYLGRDIKASYSPFENQEVLANFTIGEQVTKLSGLAGLPITKLTIPSSVISIAAGTFNSCTQLKELIFEDGEKDLSVNSYYNSKGLFNDCPLTYLYLGRNLNYSSSSNYGYSPFANQKTLATIEIGNKVSSINNYCFYGCSGINDFYIPANIITIGNEAFTNCTNIEKITIEDSDNVLSFGVANSSSYPTKGLFSSSKLKTIYIGRNFTASTSPFNGQIELDNVTIGNKVTNLPNGCFYDCSSIQSISIPESIISIGQNCFYGCSKLCSVILPNGISSIENGVFNKCVSLTDISLPSSVTLIGNNSFSECISLSNIVLPTNLISFGTSCFNGCSSLESLIFPSTVQSIGNNSFNGCTALKKIKFSDSEESLQLGYNTSSSSGLFGGCPLEEIYIGRNIITNNNYTPFNQYTPNFSVSFGSNVTSLPAYCFANCIGLIDIQLPISLLYIGNYCFRGCQNLKSINIPENVKQIGNYAFSGCSGIEDINYTPKTEFAVLSSNVFDENVMKAKYLIISDYQKTIDATYDSYWSGFRNIIYKKDNNIYVPVPWNMEMNSRNAIYSNETGCIVPYNQISNFKSNSEVYALHLENDISNEINSSNGYNFIPDIYWGFNRFFIYGEGGLMRDVQLEDAGTLFDKLGLQDIQAIQGLTLSGNINGTDIMTINRMSNLLYLNLKNANIVEGGQTYRENYKTKNDTIGSEFFYNASKLQTLVLPSSCVVLEKNALKNMSSLINIVLGENLNYIDEYAFNGCSSLFNITIPSNVVKINNYAFEGCSKLCNIKFEDSLQPIELGYGYSSSLFGRCPLEKLYLGRDIECKSSTGVFQGQKSLKHLTIGDNVKTILNSMFESCSSLEDFILPDNIEFIGSEAFYGCSSLNEISIPNKVSEIPNYAFYNCSNLLKISLGSGVTTIADNAFRYCSKVEKLISLAPLPPVITNSTFSSINKTSCQLIVTKGNLVYYWLDPIWNQFLNISDELYSLYPLPDVKYGHEVIDLADYAPDGIKLTYESSNTDVAKIEGTLLTIQGAGTVTIGAILPEDGVPMEIIGQMRQFTVQKADLMVSVQDITIKQGEQVKGFEYISEGLCYEDNLNDIKELPIPLHNVNPDSQPGEYIVTFEGGYDDNYNIKTKNAKIIILESDASINDIYLDENTYVEIYTIGGIKLYEGIYSNANISSGTYIVKKGTIAKKVYIK